MGLFPLVQEVAYTIYDLWGDVLWLNEGIFELDKSSTGTISAITTGGTGGTGGDDNEMNWERPIDLITSC